MEDSVSSYAAPLDISKVTIKVEKLDVPLQHGVNESYQLDVNQTAITISSPTVWGALHALSTLEQLVEWDKSTQRIFFEREVSIKDSPNYPYRGVMIDTARNFYTVQALMRQIDAMSLCKLNVFHWHIVDSQSWPVHMRVYPDMVLDAYSPAEVYSLDDVRNVVQYGMMRGVRVIPELDMPAHSSSGWRRVNTEIIACADSFWAGYGDNWNLHTSVQPTPGHLDIMHPSTLPVVQRVYEELSSVFNDNFFHIGMDEIVPNCYNYSQHVTDWFAENRTRTYSDLVQVWVDKMFPMFLNNRPNRKLIMWEDAVLSKESGVHHLPSSSVILQSWKGGKDNIRELLRRGYDIIATPSDFFYLDCGGSGFLTNDPRYNEQNDPSPGKPSFNHGGDGGSWCAPYKTWQRIYDYDFSYSTAGHPLNYNLSQVLGASVALWSEQSDDNVVDAKIWPRAAALGELLWSGNRELGASHKRTAEFAYRIANFRERLVITRGIRAEVLMPRDCVLRPHTCDYYMNQSVVL